MRKYIIWYFLLLFGLFLSACGIAAPEVLPPEEIIAHTTQRMAGLPGFHFLLERSGHPAYIDANETIAFRRAEGDYVAPDSARANVRVITPGLIAEVKMVGIGEDYWETNFLTGEWDRYPIDQGFNPAVLFDSESGFQMVLENDLSELRFIGFEELEEMPGKSLYALQGTVAGERLYKMSYGMIGPDTMQISLWIDPDKFDIYRVLVIDPTNNPTDPTLWTFDFWNFGETADIKPPPTE